MKGKYQMIVILKLAFLLSTYTETKSWPQINHILCKYKHLICSWKELQKILGDEENTLIVLQFYPLWHLNIINLCICLFSFPFLSLSNLWISNSEMMRALLVLSFCLASAHCKSLIQVEILHWNPYIWILTFGSLYLDLYIWILIFESLHLDPCIWILVFESLHLNPCIWILLFKSLHLKPYIWILTFETLHLNPNIWRLNKIYSQYLPYICQADPPTEVEYGFCGDINPRIKFINEIKNAYRFFL